MLTSEEQATLSNCPEGNTNFNGGFSRHTQCSSEVFRLITSSFSNIIKIKTVSWTGDVRPKVNNPNGDDLGFLSTIMTARLPIHNQSLVSAASGIRASKKRGIVHIVWKSVSERERDTVGRK